MGTARLRLWSPGFAPNVEWAEIDVVNPYGHPRFGLVSVLRDNIDAASNDQATRSGMLSLDGGRSVQLQVSLAVDGADVNDDVGTHTAAHAWYERLLVHLNKPQSLRI